MRIPFRKIFANITGFDVVPRHYVPPPTAEEFFADCEGDSIKMIDKMNEDWNSVTFAQLGYAHRAILEDHRKILLSWRNGSAAISKIDSEGSTPFDSANS